MAWFRRMGMDSVDYHRATVLGREDDHPGQALGYYASRGETPLVWGGKLAERLGLDGPVDEAGYEALYGPGGARDPHFGTRLVATRRPGVELVVAAHKSVAVLGLVGRAEDMHAILDAETDATLEFLELWMSRQGGRRGKAQRRCGTAGLVWARTRHATSRSGDPAPHDHVLVANLTEMLDGTGGWKGLDTALVRDVTHAATMAGRLAGAAEAVRRGYAIVADQGPSGKLDHWAIAGIPAKVCDAFSKRSDEIELAMESSGFSSYRARGIAARRTRAPKTVEPTESLLVRWLDELDSIDWPTPKLRTRLCLVNERDARPLRTLGAGERSELVRSLLGPGGALAGRKAFTRADVVRLAAPALYGCDPAELEAMVTAVVRDLEALALVGTPAARSRAYVAASVVAAEAAVEEVAARLAGSGDRPAVAPAVVAQSVMTAEDRLGRTLTDGQHRAVAAICGSGRGLDVVVGVAGSGKTTALEVVRSAFEAEGHLVLGTAISGQAARSLATEAGVESRTVASVVWRLEHGQLRLDQRTVLLIDEVGMADDTALLRLLVAVEAAGAKAVLIGDHHQLGAVGPGGGLEALVGRHGPAVVVLRENVRQRDPAERAALEQLRAGSVAKAVAWYRDQDRIVARPGRDEALAAAAAAWDFDRRAGHDTALLAWRRRDVAALNRLSRARLVGFGEVAGPELEARGGKRYAAGDRVVLLAPGDGRWVTSERAEVVAVGADRLTLRFDDGRQEVLAGDELDDEHLDYAYALTVHRNQAATVDRAHVFADGGGQELGYVAMSRARGPSLIYATADDLDQAVEDLVAEWSRSTRQRWVLDTDAVAGKDAAAHPKLSVRQDVTVRMARLRAERDAVAAVAPDATARVRVLDAQLRLEHVAQRHLPSEPSAGGSAVPPQIPTRSAGLDRQRPGGARRDPAF